MYIYLFPSRQPSLPSSYSMSGPAQWDMPETYSPPRDGYDTRPPSRTFDSLPPAPSFVARRSSFLDPTGSINASVTPPGSPAGRVIQRGMSPRLIKVKPEFQRFLTDMERMCCHPCRYKNFWSYDDMYKESFIVAPAFCV